LPAFFAHRGLTLATITCRASARVLRKATNIALCELIAGADVTRDCMVQAPDLIGDRLHAPQWNRFRFPGSKELFCEPHDSLKYNCEKIVKYTMNYCVAES
jgi:hypothetical protein